MVPTIDNTPVNDDVPVTVALPPTKIFLAHEIPPAIVNPPPFVLLVASDVHAIESPPAIIIEPDEELVELLELLKLTVPVELNIPDVVFPVVIVNEPPFPTINCAEPLFNCTPSNSKLAPLT